MEANELMADIYQTHSVKELAAAEKLSPSALYKWAETGEQHRLNPLEHTVRLYHQTQDRRLLDWIAERVGGRFILPTTQPKASDQKPSPTACPTRRQLEGLQTAVAAELASPWLPPKAAAHWRRQWQELLAETERRLARCGRVCESRKPCRVAERAFAFAAFLKASAGE
jgi:hypothetical protein